MNVKCNYCGAEDNGECFTATQLDSEQTHIERNLSCAEREAARWERATHRLIGRINELRTSCDNLRRLNVEKAVNAPERDLPTIEWHTAYAGALAWVIASIDGLKK
jgi:hypothetical protein